MNEQTDDVLAGAAVLLFYVTWLAPAAIYLTVTDDIFWFDIFIVMLLLIVPPFNWLVLASIYVVQLLF